jgi:flagellar FliJ protein
MAQLTDWTRLREIAEQRRDHCTMRLAEATRLVQDAQRKLQLLQEYRREYLARMAAASRAGIHGAGLRNYQMFLGNLDRAIEQQTETVAQTQDDRARVQSTWTSEQRTVHSYGVLHDRQQDHVQSAQRREQQKLQDEFAARPLPRFLSGAD